MLAGFTAAMSFSGSEDVFRFFADEELAGIVEDGFITVGLDFATVISSSLCSCTLFAVFGAAYQAGILWAASRAEMADVKQIQQMIPLFTCEIPLG